MKTFIKVEYHLHTITFTSLSNIGTDTCNFYHVEIVGPEGEHIYEEVELENWEGLDKTLTKLQQFIDTPADERGLMQ